MYYFLVLVLIILASMAYFFYHGEIMCPPVLVAIMFFVCSVFGLYRVADWELDNYSFNSVILISLGVVSFAFFGFFGYLLAPNKYSFNSNQSMYRERIELGRFYILFSMLVGIASVITFFLYIKRTIALFGMSPGSISTFLLNYYQIKVYNTEVAPVGLVKYLGFFSNINACLALYVLLHNICFRQKKKTDIWLIFIIGFWIVHALLDSSRGTILLLLAEAVYCIYFFSNMYFGWGEHADKLIVSWGIKAFIVVIIGFTILTVVMGRKESFSDFNIMEYLIMYTSCGIRNFDIFVNSNMLNSDVTIWGKETFFSINRFLYNHFGIGQIYSNNLEYAYIGSLRNGNIYTSFRRFYADFGVVGLVGLSGLLGFFYTKSYKKIRNSCRSNVIGFRLLLFSYLSPELFFMPIEERFFTNDFSVNGLFKIGLLFVMYFVFVEKRVRIRFRSHKLDYGRIRNEV